MVNSILKILDLFGWAFRSVGVDYEKLRILIWAKLTVDNRQEKSVAQRKGKKDISRAMLTVMLIYAFIGLFIGLMLLWVQSVLVGMVFVFGAIMVMTAVSLIADFSSVLLDTTDNAILLHRPVDSRTLGAARITHIIIYLMSISLSLSLASLIVGSSKFGPMFTLAFIPGLALCVLFVVFLSSAFYFLLFRISSQEAIRDVILYFQIFMAAFAMASYQILPRLVRLGAIERVTFPVEWWSFLIPPAWMAAFVDMAVTGEWGGAKLALFLIGVGASLASGFLVVRFLAPGLSWSLARAGTAGSSAKAARPGAGKEHGFPGLLSRVLISNEEERAAFHLTWRISSRDRKFKLKTYPYIGYMVVLAMVFAVLGSDDIIDSIRTMPLTKDYLFFLYAGCILLPAAIMAVRFSDRADASWVYRCLPFSRPGLILRGSLKALLVKFGLTAFGLYGIGVVLVWGPKTLDDIVLAGANTIITSLVVAHPIREALPFSRKYGVAQDAHRVLVGFLLLLIPASLGLAHYGLTFIPYGVLIGILVSVPVAHLLLRAYGRTSWQMVRA